MKLLEADQAVAPPPDAQAPPQAPPEPAPAPPEGARVCKGCGAPMEAEQDWCLTCGTAAPGRLGQRPGWRAASTILALTALLVLGAIGAGYAAINDNGSTSTQAQVPPTATPPAATTTPPPATTTPPAAATPPGATTGKPSTLPKLTAPNSSTSAGTPITPVPSTTTPTTSTPAAITPPASTPPASTPPASTPTTTTPTHSTPSTSATTPEPAGPTAITVPASAGAPYDPYHHSSLAGDPKRALDGKLSTSWFVVPTTPPAPGTGYVVDLGKKHALTGLEIQTSTPGFKVEVYASSDAKPPPDILDARWAHIGNAVDVGKDQKVKLLDDPTKYRNVLLWFTLPPKDGARIQLSELTFLG